MKKLCPFILVVAITTAVSCEKESADGTVDGAGYVDLGLSVKWATCNVGASKPWDYGSYLSWDSAKGSMSGNWRVPTKEECLELIDNCDVTWTSNYNSTGTAGRLFTSKKNGKSIFLPAAGIKWGYQLVNAGSIGGYWSSTLYIDPSYALSLYFDPGYVCTSSDERDWGESVRPVTD